MRLVLSPLGGGRGLIRPVARVEAGSQGVVKEREMVRAVGVIAWFALNIKPGSDIPAPDPGDQSNAVRSE